MITLFINYVSNFVFKINLMLFLLFPNGLFHIRDMPMVLHDKWSKSVCVRPTSNSMEVVYFAHGRLCCPRPDP